MASEALNKLLNETSQNIKQTKDGMLKYRNIDNDTLQLFRIIHKTTDNCPTLHMNYTLNKITTKEYKNRLTEHLKKKTLTNKLKRNRLKMTNEHMTKEEVEEYLKALILREKLEKQIVEEQVRIMKDCLRIGQQWD